MPYQQDEHGQWWYVARRYRARAVPDICVACGKTFHRRASDRHIRHCSKHCGLRGEHHPHWRGGRTMQKGYVLVLLVDDGHVAASMRSRRGYVPEHRLVLAEHLGRALRADEQVHHLNGNKADNRLENLQLVTTRHGPGAAFRCTDCGSHNVEPIELVREGG